jgi:hypothetical protein
MELSEVRVGGGVQARALIYYCFHKLISVVNFFVG